MISLRLAPPVHGLVDTSPLRRLLERVIPENDRGEIAGLEENVIHGRPKAAAVYHRGWTNLLCWFGREFAISPADKNLVMSSISFDITQRSMAMLGSFSVSADALLINSGRAKAIFGRASSAMACNHEFLFRCRPK